MPSFWRTLHTVFHGSCTSYTTIQSVSISAFSTSLPAFVILCLRHPTFWQWGGDISLWHWSTFPGWLMMPYIFFSTYMLVMCISSFENCLLSSFTHFLTELVGFFKVVQDINNLLNRCNIVSYLLTISFALQ